MSKQWARVDDGEYKFPNWDNKHTVVTTLRTTDRWLEIEQWIEGYDHVDEMAFPAEYALCGLVEVATDAPSVQLTPELVVALEMFAYPPPTVEDIPEMSAAAKVLRATLATLSADGREAVSDGE